MNRARREFLVQSTLELLGAAVAASPAAAQQAPTSPATPPPPPGQPPAFGTAPAVGPAVSAATFAEAEKLVRVEMTDTERAEAAQNWRQSMAPLYERRTGPRKVALEPDLAPYSLIRSVQPGLGVAGPARDIFVRSTADPGPLPSSDEDIAYAPLWKLSRWIEQRHITSTRLTQIYLDRLQRFNPKLRCVITLTAEPALAQAKQADAEIAAGQYRGPLHGIPWGAKDLLDTAGIPTTWGAEPFRNRIPQKNATVVDRLNQAGAVLVAKLSMGALALNDIWFGGQTMNPWNLDEGSSGSSAGPGAATAAGAVLVAKLSMGALALNDIWFGGQTMNPWNLDEGSSGSSAGPGAATAAGLVGFSIGSETGGSIVSPSMRCGVTGLRPTFGRVPRTGAMTLCWSLDKLGPMTRGVEDTMLILQTISGPDAADTDCVPSHLDYAARENIRELRVGYFPKWMNEPPATDVDRAALKTIQQLGMRTVEVSISDWPYDDLDVILFAESAASFEEITLNHQINELKMQVPDAWPNTFRQSRFLSAVDFVQSDRFRRKVAAEMARLFTQVDLLFVPSLRDEMLTISNNTGQPSLTLRAGFVEVSEARSDWAPDPAHPLPKFNPPRRVPHGITLLARHFEEGALGAAGLALEHAFNVMHEHPPGF